MFVAKVFVHAYVVYSVSDTGHRIISLILGAYDLDLLLQITEQLKFPPSGRDFRPKWAEIPSSGRKFPLFGNL